MEIKNIKHIVEFKEENRTVKIYRESDGDIHLYTSVEIPDIDPDCFPNEYDDFCRLLGENLILDSPIARKIVYG